MKICVYTCITGDYDNLREVKIIEKNVDYLCFTNNKNLKSKTWKIIQINDSKLDNHHLSRKIKMLGHPIISKNYDISVWMDASVIWRKPVSEFIKIYLKDAPFAAFKHSQRSSIKEEAIACLKSHKDKKENILQTLTFLKSENFPDNSGLFEMTAFIKKHNDPIVIKTMELWFDINQKYSKRDQLEFMYAAWKTGLKINTINLNVWDNPWFFTIPHNNSTNLTECHVYFGDSHKNFNFDNYFICNYQEKSNLYTTTCIIPHDTTTIEISPINTINLLITNLVISPSPKHIDLPLKTQYLNGYLIYSENDIIRITGDFKKNQKLSLSIEAHALNPSELYQIIQKQLLEINQLKASNTNLLNINQNQIQTINNLKKDYQKIINSKSWRLIQKARKILPPYNSK